MTKLLIVSDIGRLELSNFRFLIKKEFKVFKKNQ